MLYGRLLDKNGYRCEPLTDLSYPVVLLQRGESRGDRFIESLRGDLYGVLNVSKILYRNRACSKNHDEGNIFAFCSPARSSGRLLLEADFSLRKGRNSPRSPFRDDFRVAGRVFPSFNQPTCTRASRPTAIYALNRKCERLGWCASAGNVKQRHIMVRRGHC